MSDEDLIAIYKYLKTLKPHKTGQLKISTEMAVIQK
jgi:hypothetical protein